jgi:hypothetical protein
MQKSARCRVQQDAARQLFYGAGPLIASDDLTQGDVLADRDLALPVVDVHAP